MIIKGKKVLITGGTGTLGHKFVEVAIKKGAKKIYVFSRDEKKQFDMRKLFPDENLVSFLIGDIRDYNRLKRAFSDIDIVIHAAAQKHVASCEYNPYEAVQTNIIGGQNVIDAAIDCSVKRVLFISTDKSVSPINLYGATKLCMEKIATSSASYIGNKETKISIVRYGNVIGSRGSVVEIFKEAEKNKTKIPITSVDMTRFWITIGQAVNFIILALKHMFGGDIFIPKIPSMKITELAEAIYPDGAIDNIGVQHGEKLHEILIPSEESENTFDCGKFFIIKPNYSWYNYTKNLSEFKKVEKDFSYSSDKNKSWLSVKEMREILCLKNIDTENNTLMKMI